MDRRAVLAVVAAVAIVAAVIGWVAGQRIQSPAEVAADAAPPAPSLITVPVELRTLSQNVVVRGTITPSDETELVVASVDGESVVTGLPKDTGDLIAEGDVIIEVAGRPVIALEGPLPAFRNMIPSLEGPDVRQLEEALVRLGYDPGPVDDSYSPVTAAAVASLYRDRGYRPPTADDADLGALDAAEAAVAAQEDALDAAEDALDESRGGVTQVERDQLDLVVSQAEVALAAARAAAETAKAEAAAAVADAERAKTRAAEELARATRRLHAAQGGTHPDTGQPPTPDELADLEQAERDARTALADAEAALHRATDDKPRIEAQQDIDVRSAEVALAQAKADRTERLQPPDVAGLQEDVADARADLEDAREELAEAQRRVGAWLPQPEVEFFTSLPRQVGTVFTEVGDTPTGAAMTISGAETLVQSGVSSADRSLIELGAEALMEDDELGLSIPAEVTFVADAPGGPGLSEDRYALRLEPLGEVPEDAIGVNLRVSIPITSSGGDVLAVPLAALSAGPDGTARVEVERSDGITELVEVVTGLRAEGFVEIEPIDATLEEGDRVVVGRDLELPGSSGGGDEDGDDESDEEGEET